VTISWVLGGGLGFVLDVGTAGGAPSRTAGPDARRRAVAAQLRGDSAGVLKGLKGVVLRSEGGALLMAQALEAQGRLPEALRVLRRAPQRGGLALHVDQARAALLARMGRIRSAARLLAKVERSRGSPLAGGAALVRAGLLLRAHSPRTAARRFRWLRHRYPRYPDLARLLYGEASGLLMAGQFPAASRLVRTLLLRYPAAAEAVWARRDLNRLRAANIPAAPFSTKERVRRAVRLGRAGRVPEAVAELETLAGLPGADGTHLALMQAKVYMANYRYADAVKYLDRARTGSKGAVKWEAERRLSTALRRAGLLERLWRRSRARVTPQAGRPAPSPKTFWAASKIQLLRGNRIEAARLLERAEPARRRGILAGYLAFRNRKLRRGVRILAPLVGRRRIGRAARYWLARTRLAQGRRAVGYRMLRNLAVATPLDWYAVLARARLRQLTGHAGPTVRPVEPLPLRRSPHLDSLVAALRGHRPVHPRLAQVMNLLRWGLWERGLAELRVVARDHLLAAGGRRGRLLRPISRWEAFGGVRHLAKPRRSRGIQLPAAGASRGSVQGLSRVLYRAFRRLGDPYMANRFVRRDAGRPRLSVQTPYAPLVRTHAQTASLQPGWVWAVMTVESAYCAEVVSHAGALGLLQIMPLTGRRIAQALGVRSFRLDQLFEPAVNIRFGAWYLGQLVRKFGGQLALAAAAYNGGPHNVEQWLRARAATAELDEFVEEIPMRETRLYVKKVVGLAARYAVGLGEPYAGLVELKLNPRTVDCIDF
jgi:peptidoglycan lytic transglycosylase